MKETVRSLRLYFGVFGALGVVANIVGFKFELSAQDTWALLTRIYYFGISCAALYASFALPRLLRTRLDVMVALIEVGRVQTIIAFILAIAADKPGAGLKAGAYLGFGFGFGLWLQGYLKKNLKRLAAEGLPSASP